MSINTEIATLRETSQVQGDCLRMLDNQVRVLSQNSRQFTEFMNTWQNAPIQARQSQPNIDAIAHELTERMSRSLNVVVFNVADNNDLNSDFEQVRNLLAQTGINVQNIRVRRVGRSVNNRPRAIIVTLSSRAEVLQVIRNRRTLPNGINVSEDRTREQRAFFSGLLRQVRAHNNENPSDPWRIKYENGVPKIVSANNSHPPKN